mmetsp:Transcript_1165/g.2176  ORF Transcript_1165/g.2176 Transcript_1165/m.2176 type:complete len:90 (+) Transcript_1165:80-349(+)
MGGFDVKKNVHIENWATMRENINSTFRFTAKNNFAIFVTGALIPYLIYKGILIEFKCLAEDPENGLFNKFGQENRFLGGHYTKKELPEQ